MSVTGNEKELESLGGMSMQEPQADWGVESSVQKNLEEDPLEKNELEEGALETTPEERSEEWTFEEARQFLVEQWENEYSKSALQDMLALNLKKNLEQLVVSKRLTDTSKSANGLLFNEWLKIADEEDFQAKDWIKKMCDRLVWDHKKKKEDPQAAEDSSNAKGGKPKKPKKVEIGHPTWERVEAFQEALNMQSNRSDLEFVLPRIFASELALLQGVDEQSFEHKDVLDIVAYLPTESLLNTVEQKVDPDRLKEWQHRKYAGVLKAPLVHLWAGLGSAKALEWAHAQGFDIHALEKDNHPLVVTTQEAVVKFYIENPPTDIDWGTLEQEWLKRAASKPRDFGVWSSESACNKVLKWLEELRDTSVQDPLVSLSTAFEIRKGGIENPWSSKGETLKNKLGEIEFEKIFEAEGEDGGMRYNGLSLMFKHWFWLQRGVVDKQQQGFHAIVQKILDAQPNEDALSFWMTDLGGYTPAHVLKWVHWRIMGNTVHGYQDEQKKWADLLRQWKGSALIDQACRQQPDGFRNALKFLLHNIPKNNARSLEGMGAAIRGMVKETGLGFAPQDMWFKNPVQQTHSYHGSKTTNTSLLESMKKMNYGARFLQAMERVNDTPVPDAHWGQKKALLLAFMQWSNHGSQNVGSDLNREISWVLKELARDLPRWKQESVEDKKILLKGLYRWYKPCQEISPGYSRGNDHEDETFIVCKWMAMRIFEGLVEQDEKLVPFIPKNLNNPFLKKMFRWGDEGKKEALAQYGGVGQDWVARLQQKILEMTLKNPTWEAQDLEAEEPAPTPAPRRRL